MVIPLRQLFYENENERKCGSDHGVVVNAFDYYAVVGSFPIAGDQVFLRSLLRLSQGNGKLVSGTLA